MMKKGEKSQNKKNVFVFGAQAVTERREREERRRGGCGNRR